FPHAYCGFKSMNTMTDQLNLLSGIHSRLAEQKSLLIHLERQNRDRRQPQLPGRQLVLRAAAKIASACGNTFLHDQLEQMEKAAVNPAMMTVAGWAAELEIAQLPSLIISLEKQSALAAILVRSPQVSILGKGVVKVPVMGAAPAAKIVGEGAP